MSTHDESHSSTKRMSALMGPQKDSYIYSKCRCCVSVFKWLPVVFITAVLSWGYYAYVFQLCIETMPSVILKCICMVVFNFLFVMTFWSYGKTIFVAPGSVPKNFWFTVEEFEAVHKETSEEGRTRVIAQTIANRQLPVMCRTYLGGFRTCEKCNLVKPDRAHHCSVCGYCVLKMDHHCPWVNNCVSFSNYKYFVLFLGYAFILCLFTASTSFYYFVKSWKNELPTWGKFHILFLFFVAIMFAISLVSLFGYHIYLIFVNRSTLESFRAPVFRFGPDKTAFNLGKYENWCQVFGSCKSKWFLPVETSLGDGIVFPTNSKHREQEQESDGRQAPFKALLQTEREQGTDQQAIITASKQSHRNFYNSFPPPGGCKVMPGALPQSVCIQMPLDQANETNSGPANSSRLDGLSAMGGDKTEPAFL